MLAVTLALSCLLTPIIYALLEPASGEWPWPYSRVFDRVVLVVLAGSLYWQRGPMDLGQLRPYWSELTEPRAWRLIGLGALLTLASALAALPLVVGGGTLVWHPNRTVGELLWRAFELIPAALVIGVLEESVFRLLLFESLRSRLTTPGAAVASSLLYAVLHFVSPDKAYVFPGWSPTVGFEYLGAMAEKFAQPGVPGGVVGLTLVGLTLCVALARGRSLALCVGLHAGWILAAKLAMKIARRAPGIEFPTGAGRRNYLVTQPAAWVAIAGVLVAVWFWAGRLRSAGPRDPVAGP